MNAVHYTNSNIESMFREFNLTTTTASYFNDTHTFVGGRYQLKPEPPKMYEAIAAITLTRYRAWNLTRTIGRPVLAIESDVEALRPWEAPAGISNYDIVYVTCTVVVDFCKALTRDH